MISYNFVFAISIVVAILFVLIGVGIGHRIFKSANVIKETLRGHQLDDFVKSIRWIGIQHLPTILNAVANDMQYSWKEHSDMSKEIFYEHVDCIITSAQKLEYDLIQIVQSHFSRLSGPSDKIKHPNIGPVKWMPNYKSHFSSMPFMVLTNYSRSEL